MIEFQHVQKSFGEQLVLKDLNFTIQKGEFFVLVGTSGSGKTTTLRMLNRLIEPSAGKILMDNQELTSFDLRALRLNTGYVLQQSALFPNLTVYENIDIIPEMKGWPKEERKLRITELMEKVGLDPQIYLKRMPRDLSGGEQQRVGIVRALIGKPEVILMDEPFSALDPIFKNQLQDLIKDLHEELGLTIVFVTHDMREAIKLGNRICIMRQGEILQLDTPEVIKNHPVNDFVSLFFREGVING